MKINKILFIATLFVAFTSNAQIDKGNWMMGVSANFGNYKSTSCEIKEKSNEFWVLSTNARTANVAPYAADAIGGILRLYRGPVWSIIQGAACSAAFD